jgi:hypothetical protein
MKARRTGPSTIAASASSAGLIPGAGVNGRPLFQKFGVTTTRSYYIPIATNRYDSLQTNLTRRFSNSLFLPSSYTWSKTFGLTAGNSDSGLRFYVPSEFYRNWTLTDFDRMHSWTAAANYELPFGRGKRFAADGAAAAIFGGWQVNPTVALYSGTPFTVGSSDASLNAPNNTQVADQITAEVTKFGGVGTGAPFYDPTAFAAVRDVRFGNMAANALRGPRLFNMNLGLFRSFQATERFNVQFRAEALNFTNTPALNNPSATVTTPASFMMITGAQQTQRTIRFGLRLAF